MAGGFVCLVLDMERPILSINAVRRIVSKSPRKSRFLRIFWNNSPHNVYVKYGTLHIMHQACESACHLTTLHTTGFRPKCSDMGRQWKTDGEKQYILTWNHACWFASSECTPCMWICNMDFQLRVIMSDKSIVASCAVWVEPHAFPDGTNAIDCTCLVLLDMHARYSNHL